MTSEKPLAANRRSAPLPTAAPTTPRRASRRNTPHRDLTAEQQFADLVANPKCFELIAACDRGIRVEMRKNIRRLYDLKALRDAVTMAKEAAKANVEFAPGPQTVSAQFADNTTQLIPATSVQREAPVINGFEFANDQIAAGPSLSAAPNSQKARVIPIDSHPAYAAHKSVEQRQPNPPAPAVA